MSDQLFFDRGQCQGQVTRRVAQPRAGEQKGGKPAEPSHYLDVVTPGGTKKFRCKAEDHLACGDGDVIYCEYEVKTFVDDKQQTKEYTSLITFETVLPAAYLNKALSAAAEKRKGA